MFSKVESNWLDSIQDTVLWYHKFWHNFEIISVFYFTCNLIRWLCVKYNTEI